MDKNIEILGYYVEKKRDSLSLELKLKNIPDAEDKIVTLGLSRHFLTWMLEELDKWEDDEEVEEKE